MKEPTAAATETSEPCAACALDRRAVWDWEADAQPDVAHTCQDGAK